MEDHDEPLKDPLLGEEMGKSITNDIAKGGENDDDALLSRSAKRASRPSIQECLAVPANETASIELDVYNMLFISDLWSQPFFYSLFILVTKMTLYIILMIDLQDADSYPFDRRKEGVEIKVIVKLAQFFLIPVAIVIQEELMVSFFVFGNIQYSPGIRKRHPGAYKWKWYLVHLSRFLDGIMFLCINTYLMLQSINMLSIFLNFSALMFLQTIDNVALKVCIDGYWTRSLQECAKDVVEMKFAFRQKHIFGCFHQSRATILWVSAAYVILVSFWVKVHFIN